MLEINPGTVDVMTLPSLPLVERQSLPAVAAIYFVLDSANHILYIGMTRSLVLRWQNHHRARQFSPLSQTRIAWLTITEPELLPVLEKSLIEYFQPEYNGYRPPDGAKGLRRYNLYLDPRLAEKAKEREEGLSALLRRLLTQELGPLDASSR